MDKILREPNIWDLHIHTPLGTPTKGRMWIKYIKEEYPMRYKSLVRFGESLKRERMKSMIQHMSRWMILKLSGWKSTSQKESKFFYRNSYS